MSNYATLIASIQSVITENGNNEITGAILQQTLLSMINSLGSGYQFVGIATPETNPGTPDQRVFYIASSGTYPNFGPVTIPADNLAILYFDTSWHYCLCKITTTFASGEEVNEVQIDNTHLVNPASGSLAKAEDAMELKEKLDGVTLQSQKLVITADTGYISSTSGGHMAYSSNKIASAEIPQGTKKVKFLGIEYASSINKGYAFYDSSNNPIEGYYGRYDVNTSLPTHVAKEYTIEVPSNAVTFRWTTKPAGIIDISSETYIYAISGDNVKESMKFQTGEVLGSTKIDETKLKNPDSNSLAKAIDVHDKLEGVTFEKQNLDLTLHVGFVNGVDGSINTVSSIARYAEIDCNGYDRVRFLGKQLDSTTSTGWCFYDSSGDVIADAHSAYEHGSSYILQDKEYVVDVPSNAVLLRWTVKVSSYEVTNPYAIGLNGKSVEDLIHENIAPLKEDIEQLEDSVESINDVLDETLVDASYEEIEDYSLVEGERVNANGSTQESQSLNYRVYRNIDDSKKYYLETNYNNPSLSGVYIVNYFNGDIPLGNPQYLIQESETIDNVQLEIPQGTTIIKMNVVASNGSYKLKRFVNNGYINVSELNKRVDAITNKNLKVVVMSDELINIRCRYDDENDILIRIGYYQAYKYNKNSLLPQGAYIGSKSWSDSDLISNGISQSIADTVGPITMDWCGPIYANHGYCTPRVVIANNPLTSSDVGSLWHDDKPTLFGSTSTYREYIIGKVDGNNVYLLPVIMTRDGLPVRDYVYYGSASPSTLTKISGSGVAVGTEVTVSSTSRFDYQVCECRNFRINMDGVEIPIDQKGTYYCNELTLGYQQICYDASQVSQWWPTPSYENVPVQVIFDRQFIFSGGNGYMSYSSSHKMNVLRPFKLGGDFTGNPNGRYLGIAPTAFLKPDNPLYDGLHSFSCIPKLKYVYEPATPTEENYGIDFRKEFQSDFKTHPTVRLNRSSDYCEDVDNMPERIYSYLKDTSTGEMMYGVAGGHSLVRGASQNSVRNTMIPLNGFMGWWNPPVSNKLYMAIMKHGDDGILITNDFIRMNEGFFCWYKPQLTNASTGAAIHSFYYKSGDEYIVYIHTVGSHTKEESVMLPLFMDGMNVVSVVEQKNNSIAVMDDVVVANRLHVKVTLTDPTDVEECNYIVVKVK